MEKLGLEPRVIEWTMVHNILIWWKESFSALRLEAVQRDGIKGNFYNFLKL